MICKVDLSHGHVLTMWKSHSTIMLLLYDIFIIHCATLCCYFYSHGSHINIKKFP